MGGVTVSLRADSALNFSSIAAIASSPIASQQQQSSDTSLLQRIANGDAQAMRIFFTRHNARVRRFVLRLVGDQALAEDLTSDVFIEVWRHADQFKGNSQVSTWMLAIARFKALSALRQRKHEHLDEAEAAAIPDLADDPEIVVEKKDRIATLRKCMSHLSRAHREVLELAYYEDKSVSEVAELIGVPANTVKTRMFHARKRISELLQQAEISRTYQ